MSERTNPPKAFISYARYDGEAFATQLRRRLEDSEEEISLWQDRSRMEGGVGWWKQITDALDVVQFLILIMTPAAMRSEIARKEWRYARQRGVCVYPVKGVPDHQLDYLSLPSWMSKAHFFDLDREWDTFVNYLKSPCQAARVPFMAPDLPAVLVKRAGVFQRLFDELIDSGQKSPLAITTALRGAGGLGKTTIAAALCHNDDVIAAFDDGILWVTVGQKPNLQESLTKLYAALTGKRPGFVDEEDASFHLAQELEGKTCLLVIDDVWDIAHLRPFLRGGAGCSRLITTRNFEIAAESRRIDVDEMTASEAVDMLTARIPQAITDLAPFRPLAHRLGEWPLLLELANASLRQRMERGDSAAGALKYLNQKLDAQGVVAFDQRNAAARNQALTRTIELSLEQLEPEERHRYLELAIFPEDTQVPLSIVGELWNVAPFAAEELAQQFDDLSLVKFNLQTATIHLHDVLRAYLATRAHAVSTAHAKLVRAWKDPLRLSSNYAWRWLPYHMLGAGQCRELRSLLLNCDWLYAKLNSTDVSSLISDFRFIEADAALDLLQGAIRLSAHVTSSDKSQLAGQLLGRLRGGSAPEIASLLKAASRWRGQPWLRPLQPSLTPPGGGLLFTLTGHTAAVRSVALTPDGRRIVSGSDDQTVRVWSVEGTHERTLAGHSDWVRAVAVSADGVFAVSASDDHTIRIWNLDEGTEQRQIAIPAEWPRALAVTPDKRFAVAGGGARHVKLLELETGRVEGISKGHTAGLNSIAVTPDNRYVITASDDRTIKVWDMESRTEDQTWRGHRSKVSAVALTPDGTECVSAGRDDTLRLWKLSPGPSGTSPDNHIISSAAPGIRSLAVTSDRCAVAGCDDGTLKVWDMATGALRDVLEGHTDMVQSVGVTSDGRYAVSGSADRTIKVWNLRSQRHNTQSDSRDRIRVLSVSSDGRLAISTSDDQKLRVWSVEQQTEIRVFPRHSHWPADLTPDGRKIVSAAADATIQVLDAVAGVELQKFSGHVDRVRCVVVTPDGARSISASDDRTIRIWNLETGLAETVISTKRHWVRVLAVTPDGRRVLSGSDDRTVKVWDLLEATEERTLSGHEGRVNALAVTADGQQAISASDDRTIKLWKLSNGAELRTFRGHTARVNGVAVMPAGNHFVSVSGDATLRIWDSEKGTLVAVYTADSPLLTCAVGCGGIILAGDQTGNHHFLCFEA